MTTLLLALVVMTADKEKDKDSNVSVESVNVNGNGEWQNYPPNKPPPPPPPAEGSTTTTATVSAPVSGQLWSVVGPRTVGKNGNELEASIGFPGVYVDYWRGLLAELDLGLRVGVNYGFEGEVSHVFPGIKLQAQAKYRLLDTGKVSLGASFSPGLLFYWPGAGETIPGFVLPLGLNLGIVATPALNIGVTFEIPLWVRFGRLSGVAIPIMTGAGVEYFVSSSLAVWFALRMGPTIWTNGQNGEFTFDGRLGVGWRF